LSASDHTSSDEFHSRQLLFWKRAKRKHSHLFERTQHSCSIVCGHRSNKFLRAILDSLMCRQFHLIYMVKFHKRVVCRCLDLILIAYSQAFAN